MTPKEKKLLDFIGQHIRENGYAPTYQQMADRIGVSSKSHAYRIVDALVFKGRLRRGAKSATRNLYIVNLLENFSSNDLRAELARREEEPL
jgi:SOS-response transcriptional repressor LexA